MTPTVSAEVATLADRVRSARARGATLRLTGGGTWLDGGQPCVCKEPLELGALSGVMAYEPGDLTLTALASTPLSTIQRVTTAEGQWLTMDPHGSPDGTIGATVSTASSGPLASAFGTPRDHVLGCEFVTGAGNVVRGGGRVVKNVAGFDLVRLVTGAWGTLGAITEITVRLRAKPEHDVTLAVAIGTGTLGDAANVVREWAHRSAFRPLAMELLSPSIARYVAAGESGVLLLVRIGGNETHARAAVHAVSALGDTRQIGHGVWGALAQGEPAGALVFRVSALPSRIGSLFSTAATLAEELGGYAHATVTRGIVRCVVPPLGQQAMDHLLARLSQLFRDVTVIGERMTAPLWNAVLRTQSTDALSRRVRATFDPGRILNPAILGDT